MKIISILFFLLIFFSISNNQEDDLLVEEIDIRHQQPRPSKRQNQEKSQTEKSETYDASKSKKERENQLKQEIYMIGMTCVMVSKYYLAENQEILLEILKKYKEKNQLKVLKKIQANMLIECTKSVKYETAMNVFQSINSESLDVTNLTQYFGDFEWNKYQDKKVTFKLNEIEQTMVKLVESFDKSNGYNNDPLQNKKKLFENAQNDLIKTKRILYIIFGLVFIILISVFLYLWIKPKVKTE